MQNAGTQAPSIFIVILDAVLVARDVEMTIYALRPDARVVVARTTAEAEAFLGEGPIEAAIVQSDAPAFMGSSLRRRLAADGGLVVLVGHDSHTVGDGVALLPLPFTQEDVEIVVAGLSRTNKAPGCCAGGLV